MDDFPKCIFYSNNHMLHSELFAAKTQSAKRGNRSRNTHVNHYLSCIFQMVFETPWQKGRLFQCHFFFAQRFYLLCLCTLTIMRLKLKRSSRHWNAVSLKRLCQSPLSDSEAPFNTLQTVQTSIFLSSSAAIASLGDSLISFFFTGCCDIEREP